MSHQMMLVLSPVVLWIVVILVSAVRNDAPGAFVAALLLAIFIGRCAWKLDQATTERHRRDDKLGEALSKCLALGDRAVFAEESFVGCIDDDGRYVVVFDKARTLQVDGDGAIKVSSQP